ncbi:ash family protein [Enterobacter sp. CP102]|nr:ash family protein [Enterobacter sp. CP102]MDR2263028.1 ash family protein [Enterobacter asburiae]UWM63961.1 ash family protein [Enterobacter sp. CP102]
MVGWTVAPQGAPVSDEAGRTNSVQPATSEVGPSGGGQLNYSSEAVL